MSQATSTAISRQPADILDPSQNPLPASGSGPDAQSYRSGLEAPSDGSSIASRRRSARIDLAYLEYQQRIDAGEEIDAEAFCARYPSLATSLRSLLTAHNWAHGCPSDVWELLEGMQFPRVGTTYLGFHLQRELGRGTFARVFLATQPALGNRRVALKVSCHGTAEARTLGRLDHPNIVPVHSVQQDPNSELTAVCMPYLGNVTLSDVVRYVFEPSRPRQGAAILLEAIAAASSPDDPVWQKSAPPAVLRFGTYEEGVVFLGCQMAKALAYVHARGICHGDLKPSNVLMSPEGQPLLLDFNQSLADQIADQRIGGTLPYMSPEQLRATDPARGVDLAGVDNRADLFSLGVMLYELLSGKHPFGPLALKEPAAKLRAQLTQQQRQGPIPLRKVCPGIDKDLACLIERCLASNPADRPQSATEIEAGLRHYLAPSRRMRRWVLRRKKATMAAACGLLLLTAAAAVGASYLASADISTQRHLELGNRAFQQGRTTEAIEHFQAALFLDQGFAPARLARARAFLKADLYNEAVTDFQILNRETGNADGRLLAGLGYAYLLKGDNVNAIHSFREALRNGFATAAVHNDLAYCLIESGEPDRWSSVADALPLAYEHLAKALALKPAMQAAYINRALAALKESHLKVGFIPDNGIADAEEALKIGPASGRLHRIAAQLCSRAARLAPTRSTDATLAHLEAAATLGFSPDLIGSDAEFDWLKNEPRFQALIGRAKLPEGKETLPVVDPLAD